MRNMLKDLFGFAEHQKIATHCLGYKYTLTKGIDTSVLNKVSANNKGKIKINGIEWCVLYYTPSMEQQKIIF